VLEDVRLRLRRAAATQVTLATPRTRITAGRCDRGGRDRAGHLQLVDHDGLFDSRTVRRQLPARCSTRWAWSLVTEVRWNMVSGARARSSDRASSIDASRASTRHPSRVSARSVGRSRRLARSACARFHARVVERARGEGVARTDTCVVLLEDADDLASFSFPQARSPS